MTTDKQYLTASEMKDRITALEAVEVVHNHFKFNVHMFDIDDLIALEACKLQRERELSQLHQYTMLLDAHEWDLAHERTCDLLKARYGYQPMHKNRRGARLDEWSDHFRGLMLLALEEIHRDLTQRHAAARLSSDNPTARKGGAI